MRITQSLFSVEPGIIPFIKNPDGYMIIRETDLELDIPARVIHSL